MSLGAECVANTEFEREQEIDRMERLYFHVLNECMHGRWTTKDGRVMHVSEMTESHIQNCINMLERNNHPYKGHYIEMFQKELREREGGEE